MIGIPGGEDAVRPEVFWVSSLVIGTTLSLPGLALSGEQMMVAPEDSTCRDSLGIVSVSSLTFVDVVAT